jgi:Rod binding domain-containing protein
MQKLLLNSIITSLLLILSYSAFAEEASLENRLNARAQEIDKVSQDMEEIMLLQFLKQMNEGVSFNTEIDNTPAIRMHKDLMIMQYAKVVAQHQSIGLARHVSEKIKKIDTSYNILLNEVRNVKK